MKKGLYKKIFVIGAALFILFAPVGVTMTGTTGPTGATSGLGLAVNTPQPMVTGGFAFPVSFTMNLAFATTTTGTGAGTSNDPIQPPSFLNCATSPATCGVYYASLVVNGTMALLMALGGWLIQLGLQFNNNIFNAPAVQIGFSVSLAVANLGFVLGIIIIAIATIIRNETYGIKQLLWKLVVMAILVNFGLVITAPIVGFANGISNYFINATTPTLGASGDYSQYVAAMMGAFNPQTPGGAMAANNNNGGTGTWTSICQSWLSGPLSGGLGAGVNLLCQATNTPTTSPQDDFWQKTMALMFDIVFSAIAVFTFSCLAILLVIRYLVLGGLLIILPLAWLTFIFPKFDNNFSKWWNTFVKWVFFPPIALFFIYLAFTTAVTTNTANNNAAATYTATVIAGNSTAAPSTNNPVNSLAKQTGLNENIFAQAGDEILLAGLMIMGLMFALSLAGKAGETVVHAGGSMTKGARNYIGRKTAKTAARAYQKLGGENMNAALQRSRIPLVSIFGRKAADLTEAGTKQQVESRHKDLKLKDMDDTRLVNVTQGLNDKEDQLAAVKEWQGRGKLDKIERIGGTNFADWLKKNQSTFGDYHQDKLKGEVDTALGSDAEIRRIAEVKGAAAKTATAVDTNGIVGTAGATVSASDLAGGARVVAQNAQEAVDTVGANTIIEHNGRNVSAADLLAQANAAAAQGDDAMTAKSDNADIKDETGLLGPAGQIVKAGNLMQKAAEKFWAGKNKKDAQNMRADAIFGDKPKFGLDPKTMEELGKSIAHGVTIQAPGIAGTIAGKIDNWKQVIKFGDTYTKATMDARDSGQLTPDQATERAKAMKKILAGKLTFAGGGHDDHGDDHAPTPTPGPTPEPPH
jgi:hypothetical protein